MLDIQAKGHANVSDIEHLTEVEAVLLKDLQEFVHILEQASVGQIELIHGNTTNGTVVVTGEEPEALLDESTLAAIHHSGLQRMRTQKMVLKYCMVLANFKPVESLSELLETAEAFDVTAKGLRHGDQELGLVPTDSDEVCWLRSSFKA